ncbi:ASCH domain-containing protein [Paenibacillus graminis]|uniref:RNA-binding protein n=1 Tax=Paenibacillus graminis TaxID=189425 RepID=A0A089M7Q0_9BACL|nr:ASCH domain-containing protein [Paenibacillus graminis]AIQ67518.1 RNA-binding protein [Paenibacillus graminis]
MTEIIAEYWKAYLEEHPEAADLYDSAWAFGDNDRLADELLALVLEGVKTAMNYELNEVRGLPLPFIGGHSIILDSQGMPRGIIRTTKCEVVPFHEVTAEFAYSEGEDDRTLESWRYHHEAYFTREMKAYEMNFDPGMRVVCENFELVYRK